jgi:TRAP-type uncharacterized transport system fused permease subunit
MDRIWANTRRTCSRRLSDHPVPDIRELSIGWFMLVLITGICLYPFSGSILPQPLTTKAYPLMQTIGNFAITLNSGIYATI